MTPEEVEEVCRGKVVIHKTYNNRLRMVGATQRGRLLTVIIAPYADGGVYYPVTARPTDRKERKMYHTQQPEEEP